MTIAPQAPAESDAPEPEPTPEGFVRCTVDGFDVVVPKDTLIIRAAEIVGVAVPRFCDHPLLDPVGACRQCIVEVEGQRKPVASCTVPVTEGMVIKTQLTSGVAEKAQAGTLEMLLLNHPLDCPVCDKGGECPLQNQAMSNGHGESRFHEKKRTYPKPIAISSEVLLDRERCVLCARCTRFSEQIAGDPFIEMFERGALQQVAIAPDVPFQSYFSGNTVQICPVGALTGAAYRFRSRPFDLVSEHIACEHCASGCDLRADHRRGKIQRRLAGNDPQVNEEWNCDKGRWAFTYSASASRLNAPLVRDPETGELVAASWTGAVEVAAGRIGASRSAAVLAGGRLTVEDAYAWGAFARLVLGTNDVDMRARPHSAEETEFLTAVAAVAPDNGGVTYDELEAAPAVVLAGLEPEEESPIVFLRLRKAVQQYNQRVAVLQPFATPAARKLNAQLVPVVPGGEAEALGSDDVSALLSQPGAVLLVGERLATSPGALSKAAAVAAATGAKLAWVPRRAGEKGSLYAGLFPTTLPGGRPVADDEARAQVAGAWGIAPEHLPTTPGRDTAGILAAAAAGELDTLVLIGVDLDDLPDPAAARAALDKVGTLIVLDLLDGETVQLADVVFPVAADAERDGSYADWEGRLRTFGKTLHHAEGVTDGRVAHLIAAELGVDIGAATSAASRTVLEALGAWGGAVPAQPTVPTGTPATAGSGQAVLATWRHLLDDGTLQAGEPHLAGTRRPAVARVSAATASSAGVEAGGSLAVSTGAGTVTLPVEITDMPDQLVWLPGFSPGSHVQAQLGAVAGDVVSIAAGSTEVTA